MALVRDQTSQEPKFFSVIQGSIFLGRGTSVKAERWFGVLSVEAILRRKTHALAQFLQRQGGGGRDTSLQGLTQAASEAGGWLV